MSDAALRPRAHDNANDNVRLDGPLKRAVQEFKPDAAAIEEAPVPLTAHAALYAVMALLLAAIIWSAIGTVDRIVVAPGKIATRTPMLVMQPFTTSRVLDIPVKAGDHVKKGQLLVRFDPAFAQADVSSLEQKVASLSAQVERLDAELAGRAFIAGPQDAPERVTQGQIFLQEMSDHQAEINQRDNRLQQIESQIAVDQQSLPGIQQQLGMAERVVGMYDRLARQKAAATLDIMRAQSSLIDAQLRYKNTQGDLEKQMATRAEVEHERQAYLDKWRSDRSQQLVQARQDLSEASEALKKADRIHELTELTAPVDGVVQQVADRTMGSVVREAETLVTIVPDGAALYVEANVPSRDISYLKVGDTVRVKLESYPFQRFGTVSGTLSVISPDSLPLNENDAKSPMVYRVQVDLNDDSARLAMRGMRLKPGLVASAEIKTGTRTIASYILNPVLRLTDESMREP
jgi:HlyD family secretion protein